MKPLGRSLSGHTIHVTTLAFSPNGKTLISGSWDGTMRMWSLATGRQIGLMRNSSSNVFYQVSCLPSTPRKQRFLTVVGAFAPLNTLMIRDINMVDPDLYWASRGRDE